MSVSGRVFDAKIFVVVFRLRHRKTPSVTCQKNVTTLEILDGEVAFQWRDFGRRYSRKNISARIVRQVPSNFADARQSEISYQKRNFVDNDVAAKRLLCPFSPYNTNRTDDKFALKMQKWLGLHLRPHL